MKIKCVDCKGTGRINAYRCRICNGTCNTDIEPAEYLRQNRIRSDRNLPKLIRV